MEQLNSGLLNTYLGKIVYHQFGYFIQYKNLSNHDLMWTVVDQNQFIQMLSNKPVETFYSKRLNGWAKDKIKLNLDMRYWLAEKNKSDGYLYEIPNSLLRLYTKKEYPNVKFPYTKYHMATIKQMSYRQLEQAKTNEVIKFNGSDKHHSVSDISMICDAVYKYCKNK